MDFSPRLQIMTQPNISADSLVLAIDTATPVQSVALVRQQRVLFEAQAPSVHAEGPGLLALVDAALRHTELRIHDVDRFVVSRGPGAFSGLRVSMAMLKSFALTLDRPLYSVSSLEALARDAMPAGHLVAACIDARRGEIYTAFYRFQDGRPVAVTDELLLKPAELAAFAQDTFPGEFVVCIGSAFPHYEKAVSAQNLCCRPAAPRAAILAQIVLDRFPTQLPDVPIEALEPKYIRIDDFALPKPFDFSTPESQKSRKSNSIP